MSIVDAVVNTPSLSILKTAVLAAGLADTLKSGGPFTVFAPTDDAFKLTLARLNLTADQLLANKPLLTEVLKTHVVSGVVTSRDITRPMVVQAINDSPAAHRTFLVEPGVVLQWNSVLSNSLQTARVIKADVMVSNGVVHIINNVIV
jgi:uncharacterized surface protein with fasciclin (FAS1) repeats